MSDIELVFEKIFKVAVYSMHINGSYPTIVRDKRWFLKFLFVSFINLSCLYLLCYSTLVHDIRSGNFTEACKNISMIIICMNTTIKYLVLLYHRESVLNMIGVLKTDYEVSKNLPPEEQDVVKRYAREGRIVCLFWLVCASSGSAIFPLKAIVLTTASYFMGQIQLVPMFDLTFPGVIEQHKDSLSMFCGIFALCFVFGFYAAIIYIGFDPLIPIFTLHTCGQLDLLGRRISKALSEARNVQETKKRLKDIVIKLQELYRFVNSVQTDFTSLNEFNMKTTIVIVPIVGFHIVEDIRINKFNYEFLILLAGAIIHFLMPCYFSDLLMERSEVFRQNIYSCGWEKHPDHSVRQTVLFMLTRASRPLGISTVFDTICLETFTQALRQSYALFNLMNAAWGKTM